MFGRLGTTELLLILGIALLIFGPTKLPKLGKALGQVRPPLGTARLQLQQHLPF